MAWLAVRVLALTLPVYFAWEMLQAPAFTGMPSGWWAATAVCAQATAGDGVIVLSVFAMGALMFHDVRWFTPPSASRYTAVVLVGVILQVVIERVMVHRLGRWGYQPWHPQVPVLGVGLLPVLQPIVLLPIVFWGLAWIEPSAERAAHDSRRRVQGGSA